MKIVKAMVGGLALVAAPMLAHAADDMSYRYFQVGYLETDVDFADESVDGFGTRGSFGFADNFFIFTEYNSQEFSETGVDLDIDQLTIGLGGHYPLNENIDLVGRIGAGEIDLELVTPLGSAEGDESGYLVAAGLRGQVGDSVELEFGVVHQDFGDDLGFDLSDTGFEVMARYYFTKRWAASVEYQDIGDFSSVLAGVRYSFGQ
jgi:Outer membrane protein beta-barrel domain